ncbi:hypothetical protein L7F22_011494 [Adiantum nelumboides]|nr:hypothetical protein [Adiantum nelumboides]
MEALRLQHFSPIRPSIKRRTPISTNGHCRTTCRLSSTSRLWSLSYQSQLVCRSVSGESGTAVTNQSGPGLQSEKTSDLNESIALLKKAAKTRKVAGEELIGALCTIEEAKFDPSSFLATIGGSTDAPGPRTWMLVFTADKQSKKGGSGKGSYVPITAVQKFDATNMTIENGVYLGPLGFLTFSGRFSWNNRILAFLFDTLNIKLGILGPFKFNIEKKEDKGRSPTNKDPFFVWHYADDEIIAARGRGGGLALWCRCKQVVS